MRLIPCSGHQLIVSLRCSHSSQTPFHATFSPFQPFDELKAPAANTSAQSPTHSLLHLSFAHIKNKEIFGFGLLQEYI